MVNRRHAAPGITPDIIPVLDSDSLKCRPILPAMLRTGRFSTDHFQRDRALHFLAHAEEYKLHREPVRRSTEVVKGFAGRCDEARAHVGIEWIRACCRNTRRPDVAP